METNLLIELGDIDRYFIWLFMVLELVKAYFVLDNLAEKERQELFMVFSLSKVFAESLIILKRVRLENFSWKGDGEHLLSPMFS